MTQQLLTLDEYNNLAAGMIQKHPKLGKGYVTYDNLGLVTHYLIRADLEYDPSKTGYQGKHASIMTFRRAWLNKIVMRMICGGRKNKKRAKQHVCIDDLFERDEYEGRRDTFCVENYVSEQEYRDKFRELEELIDAYFARPISKKKPWKGERRNRPAYYYVKDFYIHGKSYKQIALENNITEGAVQRRIKTHAKHINWDSLK